MGKMKKQEEKEVDTMLATTKYLTQESDLTVSMRKYTKERRAKGTPISPKDKRDALEALRVPVPEIAKKKRLYLGSELLCTKNSQILF